MCLYVSVCVCVFVYSEIPELFPLRSLVSSLSLSLEHTVFAYRLSELTATVLSHSRLQLYLMSWGLTTGITQSNHKVRIIHHCKHRLIDTESSDPERITREHFPVGCWLRFLPGAKYIPVGSAWNSSRPFSRRHLWHRPSFPPVENFTDSLTILKVCVCVCVWVWCCCQEVMSVFLCSCTTYPHSLTAVEFRSSTSVMTSNSLAKMGSVRAKSSLTRHTRLLL